MSNDMLFRNYIVVKKYNILRYEAQGIYVMQLETKKNMKNSNQAEFH